MITTLSVALLTVFASVDVRPFPVAGQETTIRLEGTTDRLRFTYQPESPVAEVIEVPTHGQLLFRWKPKKAGIVMVEAYHGDTAAGVAKVSVKFDGIPITGLVICLLAGTILFGGAYLFLRALLVGDTPSVHDVAMRPDT